MILPPFLQNNPGAKDAIISYCNDNLSILSAETLYMYIIDHCFPSLFKKQQNKRNIDFSLYDLKKENDLNKFTVQTAGRWLNKLGFRFHTRKKKTHYNDKQESKPNVMYQYNFIQCYFEYEIRCFCWIQICEEECIAMCEKEEVYSGIGYRYFF